jgi:hypothetical protein
MSFAARAFVFVAYLLLGVTFVAETALLFWEFGEVDGVNFATFDSHVFLFFPMLGLVALAAFYLPSCTFVDMYWRHISFGKLRFVVGLVVLGAASYAIGSFLAESPSRSVWDVKPATLAADKGEPAGCGTPTKPCERIGLLEGIRSIGEVSHSRLGLQEFIRKCEAEPLIEADATPERKRFCFASTPISSTPRLSTDAECCRAQIKYQSAIDALYADPAQQSLTGQIHRVLLPLKVFFLFVLLAISVLLTLRHSDVDRHYPDHIARIEVGVLVGAAAMIFFPLMAQGFAQSADALFGVHQTTGFRPIVPLISFLFGAWALLILLFSFRRHDQDLELAVKLAGVVVSTIAVVKYELLAAIITRYLGSGADETSVIALAALAIVAIVVLLSPFARKVFIGSDLNKT